MAHRVSPRAEAELDDIWHYVATKSRSIEKADRLIDDLTERFHLLSRHPHLGGRRDHDLVPGLRSFPTGEYVIFYRIEQLEILVVHVIRGSRDLPPLVNQ